jgi:PEP-CTERM putative exosortase interaction domain
MKPTLNPRPLLATVCVAAAALPCVASAQTTAYLETFHNTLPSGNANYQTVGWSLYWNQGANIAQNRTNPSPNTGSAISRTHVEDSATSNMGQDQPGGEGGLAFVGSSNVTEAFAFTTEYNNAFGPITTDNIHSVSFLQGNNNETTFRVALRINESWFVTEAQQGDVMSGDDFTGNTSGENYTGEKSAVKLTFDLTSESWSTLNFTSGSALSVGSTTTLPSGTVTAFGFFVTLTNGGTIRVDDFTVMVSTIPEPSTFAALAGLGALGLAATRRRRTA